MIITRKELITSYLNFFKSKGHKEIPNASLIPEDDPTVLFTTAGMHPLIPYLLSQPHPLGKKLVNIQRCIRTVDIDSVGDSYHHTFFEMMGNWSLGEYFKKEAIEWSFELAVELLELDKNRLAVSVFAGNKNAPKDEDSAKVWQSLGIKKERIVYLEDNWWEHPSNNTPCGPCTEMFYWRDNKIKAPEKFDPKDERWVEIWNDVLMGFTKTAPGEYISSKQKNVDNGRGLERVLAVINSFEDNYLTDAWQPILKEIERLSGKNYQENERTMRIIADHIKASVFIIADGIIPSNSERGYVLRRLIRRAIINLKKLGLAGTTPINSIAEAVLTVYPDYEHLNKNKEKIFSEINREEEKFERTLERGLREFEKFARQKQLSGKEAFLLYQSYGFPIEITKELAREKKIEINEDEFNREITKHQELSRTNSAGVFKSGLADNSERTTKLHTATHLLNQAIREVLNKTDIHQKGSNITPERIRFDFNFNRKLTEQELKKIEDWVNDKIAKELPVTKKEMPLEQAKKFGAQGVFDSKYEKNVTVYLIGKPERDVSKEICAGPHVENTKELGQFRIIKEESSSAGVRRIKANLVDPN
jgi:alanyl-tRNA synthetase